MKKKRAAKVKDATPAAALFKGAFSRMGPSFLRLGIFVNYFSGKY